VKKIWTIIVVLGLANVFALGGFVGWLGYSGRLSMERLRSVREMFTETVDEEQARLADEEAQAAAAAAAADNGLPEGPARNASELVAMRLEATEVDMQRIERLRREVEDLQRKLRRDQTMLDTKSAEFADQREAFAAMRERIAAIEGSEQFKKSVGVLESLKSADAKAMLDELLTSGDREQVVSYLDAMEDRTRSRIMTEFVKDGQQDLAAELLESLRTRGLQAVANGETPDDPGG
jgi:hypothetical protein